MKNHQQTRSINRNVSRKLIDTAKYIQDVHKKISHALSKICNWLGKTWVLGIRFQELVSWNVC